MAARSIAELLPRPFDQLDIDDVAAIVAGGEERESLVLELKGELRRDLVAKSCAAFANTRVSVATKDAESIQRA
jgi:hypothetical protein